MEHWEEILSRLVCALKPASACDDTRWTLIGSASTALQGCRVKPRDVDFLAAHPCGVHRFVELLSAHMPNQCAVPTGDVNWVSSTDLPISHGPDAYGFRWHFARWIIDGLKVEVAHIAPPNPFPLSKDGAGIWEAGPEIWPHITTVALGSSQVPVVPLELQLGTSMHRGLEERVSAIVEALLRQGRDAQLLRQALTTEQHARFAEITRELCP